MIESENGRRQGPHGARTRPVRRWIGLVVGVAVVLAASVSVLDPRSNETLYQGLLLLILGGTVAAALILVPARRPGGHRGRRGFVAAGCVLATVALCAAVVFVGFGCLDGIGSCAPG